MGLRFPAVRLGTMPRQVFFFLSFLSEEIRADLPPANVARRQTHTRSCGLAEQFRLCVTATPGRRRWTAGGGAERASCESGETMAAEGVWLINPGSENKKHKGSNCDEVLAAKFCFFFLISPLLKEKIKTRPKHLYSPCWWAGVLQVASNC